MHPLLVEVVSYASYEWHAESIQPGRGEEERALLTTSRFPLPMQNCPIVLLNIVGTCRQDIVSHSLTNDDQSASAIELISALYTKISPEISLVVICLYLYQKECLQKEFEKLGWNVLVVSVDGFQAQECDLVVLVTTRSSNRVGSLGESSNFLRDECRATVALSRAKHGLFLIGDIETLKGGKVWNRFISRASDFTQVVGPEYLKVLRSESFKRDRFGQLLDAGGKMIANFVDEVPQQQQHASTSAGRRQVETWRQPGQPGPSTSNNSRVEDWFEFNLNDNKLKTHTNKSNFRKRQAPEDWRQWQGTTFARTEQSKCFTCGRYGHFARECTENRGPWRSDSWRGGRGKY
uniref:CCHC-type domain-containing protein n=1 Tax=Meloidogyne hapla TaxID=6305 RepID=A0A1I8C282_MELHA